MEARTSIIDACWNNLWLAAERGGQELVKRLQVFIPELALRFGVEVALSSHSQDSWSCHVGYRGPYNEVGQSTNVYYVHCGQAGHKEIDDQYKSTQFQEQNMRLAVMSRNWTETPNRPIFGPASTSLPYLLPKLQSDKPHAAAPTPTPQLRPLGFEDWEIPAIEDHVVTLLTRPCAVPKTLPTPSTTLKYIY